MQQYRNNVQDQFGNVIANVTVTVNVRPGGGLATIFSDDGVTPKSNPFTNDSDSEFNFYADNGRYDIELTGPLTESIPDIRLLDLVGAGASSFRIFTDIATATPPTTEAVTGNFEIYDLDNDDQLASFGFQGSNRILLRNYMEGGEVRIQATPTGGGNQNIITGDPDGTTDLYNGNDNLKRMSMLTAGRVEIFSNADTDVENRFIAFSHQDGTDRAQLGHRDSNDVFTLRNMIHGGNVAISGENVGGTLAPMLLGDPDGETQLFYAGVKTIIAGPAHAGIVSVGNVDNEDRFLAYYQAGGTRRGIVGFLSGSSIFHLRNEVHGSSTWIEGEDAGGNVVEFLRGAPDGATVIAGATDVELHVNATEDALTAVANGAVSLYYNNIESLRTQDRTAADNVSGAEVLDGRGVWQDIGFNVLGQLLQNAAKTIAREDSGYDIYKNSGVAVTYTIPATAATAQTDIPPGAVIEITNEDTEALTIDGTETGITLRWCPTGGTGDRTLAQWGIARLKKRSDSLWFITGVGIT